MMESLQSWREFKACQKNRELCATRCAVRQSTKNDIMEIPMPTRAIVIARIRYSDFVNRSNSAKTESARESLKNDISMWFAHLKEIMCEYRLSKEFLAENGLVWNDCKKMAYGA